MRMHVVMPTFTAMIGMMLPVAPAFGQATLTALGDLPGGQFQSTASGVNSDGTVVVGRGFSDSGMEAFRWTSAGGMIGLGDLPGNPFTSIAHDVSADGSVVVGQGNGTAGGNPEAFRWTAGPPAGMIGLGDLPGGMFFSIAFDVSADGSVVVGQSNSASGNTAFRWTSGSGMVGIGDLPGGLVQSFANRDQQRWLGHRRRQQLRLRLGSVPLDRCLRDDRHRRPARRIVRQPGLGSER